MSTLSLHVFTLSCNGVRLFYQLFVKILINFIGFMIIYIFHQSGYNVVSPVIQKITDISQHVHGSALSRLLTV